MDDQPTSAREPESPRPELFRQAVESLLATSVRAEVRVEPLRPPQRLAPWSYAVSADVLGADGVELATGRLVLLHDPDGEDAWEGVLRLVGYASAEFDGEDAALGSDTLLPGVAWSWLTEALDERGAGHRAAGGTVTQTLSTRFGDKLGPKATVGVELRASWTPVTGQDGAIGSHLLAFVDMLCNAAGLPPEGVTILAPG